MRVCGRRMCCARALPCMAPVTIHQPPPARLNHLTGLGAPPCFGLPGAFHASHTCSALPLLPKKRGAAARTGQTRASARHGGWGLGQRSQPRPSARCPSACWSCVKVFVQPNPASSKTCLQWGWQAGTVGYVRSRQRCADVTSALAGQVGHASSARSRWGPSQGRHACQVACAIVSSITRIILSSDAHIIARC